MVKDNTLRSIDMKRAAARSEFPAALALLTLAGQLEWRWGPELTTARLTLTTSSEVGKPSPRL